ncbi:MAG: DUF2087 domain-containing protein [Pseudomonadota bacterium]
MNPKTAEEVERLLSRLLKGGPLRRLPRTQSDTAVVLALGAAMADPQRVYDEVEMNRVIMEWMSGFCDQRRLDHVTIRRYMVDHRLLHREANGDHYRTNQAIIGTIIEPLARSVIPGDILDRLTMERAERKTVHSQKT